MKGFILTLSLLLLCGCRASKETERWQREYYNQTEITNRRQATIDSLTHVITELVTQNQSHEEKDSSYQSRFESDSLVVRDSVNTKEMADGSHETTYWHWELRTRTVKDTVRDYHRERELKELVSILRDSLSQYREEKTDTTSIVETNEIQQEKETEVITVKEPWWKSLPRTIGWIVILAGIVWLVWKFGWPVIKRYVPWIP